MKNTGRVLPVLLGWLAIAAGAALLLAGCSLDYRPLESVDRLLEETPDAVLIHFTHTVATGGATLRTLQAERAEIFDRRKETRLQQVYWVEYAADGSMLSEAWAERAVWRSDREEARISGSISLHSYEERAWIYADSLSWEGEKRLLASGPGGTVTLKRENGTTVQGRGFRADFRRRQVTFAEQVQGTYVSDEGD